MKRTAPDRTASQPKPVERVQVQEGHVKARIIFLILALLIAVIAFAYAMGSATQVDSGWRTVEADTAEMNCGQDFEFNYYLGGAGVSAAAELKTLVIHYTEACETAYRVFNAQELFEGVNNLCYLNQHPNTPVMVHPALYAAFEQMDALDSRYVYLGPVYAEYHSLFFCNDDWETAGFDPYQNEDVRAYVAQAAAFARDPQAIRVELLGNNTLRLTVSEEYLAFAQENGVTQLVDLHWMKNAFIIDYIAGSLQDKGYDRGAISSYDGFVRCLGEEEISYSYHYYDLLEDTRACKAARLNYPGDTALVYLRSFPLRNGKDLYYYQFEDGSVRTPYVDLRDGLSKASVPALIATSRTAGCAETLLRILPFYAADALDAPALQQLTAEGIWPLYSLERQITAPSPDVALDQLFDGYTVVPNP